MSIREATHKRRPSGYPDMERERVSRSDHSNVFLLDPDDGTLRAADDLGEEIAENFLQSATSGQDAGQEMTNPDEVDELGGPFVETTLEQEMAYDTDASNPEDAEMAPFPSANRAL